jgi:hypothetical protein
MKVFNLSCDVDHTFEGWFNSAEEFDRQLASSLLRCPVCDSDHVRRLPAAARLNLSGSEPLTASPLDPALRARIDAIIAGTEDVGERFAEEARRIHYLEVKARGIRGTATFDERQELAEEGIEVLTLPLPLSRKVPLQ